MDRRSRRPVRSGRRSESISIGTATCLSSSWKADASTNGEPTAAPFETATLDTNDALGRPLTGPLAVALDPGAIVVTTDADARRGRVTVRAVLPPEGARAVDGSPVDISEAALGVLDSDATRLARTYNRVTFDPVPKRPEHELALYWEVFFPYGP